MLQVLVSLLERLATGSQSPEGGKLALSPTEETGSQSSMLQVFDSLLVLLALRPKKIGN